MRLRLFGVAIVFYAMGASGVSFLEMVLVFAIGELLIAIGHLVTAARRRHAPRACRGCGCTDARACIKPYKTTLGTMYDSCSWVAPELCSACAPGADAAWVHPPSELHA